MRGMLLWVGQQNEPGRVDLAVERNVVEAGCRCAYQANSQTMSSGLFDPFFCLLHIGPESATSTSHSGSRQALWASTCTTLSHGDISINAPPLHAHPHP